ncbi:hypothetical protein ACKVWL_011527 [Pyricularia oryzae]
MESAQSVEFRELLSGTTCDRKSLGYVNATQSAMAIYWKKMDVKECEFSKLLCPLKELGPIYGLYSKLVAFGSTVALPSTTFEILKDRIQHALSHGVDNSALAPYSEEECVVTITKDILPWTLVSLSLSTHNLATLSASSTSSSTVEGQTTSSSLLRFSPQLS